MNASTPHPSSTRHTDLLGQRVERALDRALEAGEQSAPCPPRLGAALRGAVCPGGGRIRPRLVLMVASACGDAAPELSDATATALELLHCASLAHDDLPCFDDATHRRGLPALHRAYGESTAVLAGDALIVLAFETLARAAAQHPRRAARLMQIVARGVGVGGGIIAGQAWELEREVDLHQYHRSKTGALFEAAVLGGAVAAGVPSEPWCGIGTALGEAYQVADDIADVLGDAARLGKPTGRDRQLARPSAVRTLGIEGATARLNALIAEAVDRVPACAGRAVLQRQLEELATALVRHLRQRDGSGGRVMSTRAAAHSRP